MIPHVPANRIARMIAHSGAKNSAIQWLEISYERKESPLICLQSFGIGMTSDPAHASRTCCDG